MEGLALENQKCKTWYRPHALASKMRVTRIERFLRTVDVKNVVLLDVTWCSLVDTLNYFTEAIPLCDIISMYIYILSRHTANVYVFALR
jgi:hypothetical protein